MKKCYTCKRFLEINLFWKSKNNKDGFRGSCKKCEGENNKNYKLLNRSRVLELSKRWRENNKEYSKNLDKKYQSKRRRYHFMKEYKMTLEAYDEKWEKQNGCCEICGISFVKGRGQASPHLDHDHINDNVRGILCLMCNHGLGNFKDKKEILVEAINYLKKYHETLGNR